MVGSVALAGDVGIEEEIVVVGRGDGGGGALGSFGGETEWSELVEDCEVAGADRHHRVLEGEREERGSGVLLPPLE